MNLLRVLLVAATLVAAQAAAQAETEAAAPIEDRPAAKFAELEHGFFVGAEAGAYLLFAPSGCSPSFTPGRAGAITAGGDVGTRLMVGLFLMGSQSDGPSNFVGDAGCSGGASPQSGDFASLTVGAMVRVNLVGFEAEDGHKRTWVYLRALAGYALLQPRGFFSGNDLFVAAGPGVEFFTHLRHFSVGAEADFVFGVSHQGPGVAVTPFVRYSF